MFTEETHGAYLAMLKRSRWGRDNVAAAWRESLPLTAGTVSTDGQTITSYGHPIGRTEADGSKTAIRCSASTTTVRHSGPVLALADRIVVCPCRPGWARGRMGDAPTRMPADVRAALDSAH